MVTKKAATKKKAVKLAGSHTISIEFNDSGAMPAGISKGVSTMRAVEILGETAAYICSDKELPEAESKLVLAFQKIRAEKLGKV